MTVDTSMLIMSHVEAQSVAVYWALVDMGTSSVDPTPQEVEVDLRVDLKHELHLLLAVWTIHVTYILYPIGPSTQLFSLHWIPAAVVNDLLVGFP